MILELKSWIVHPIGRAFIGYQYDNLSDVIQVTGSIPPGYLWSLIVQNGANLNIIPLEQSEDGSLSVTVTADMIPFHGHYAMQLRAVQGEVVKHTNQLQVYVGRSLSGDAQWPTLPTEFSQAEQRIAEYNAHPPVPGPNGYWMLWDVDLDKYVESDIPLPGGGGGGSGNVWSQDISTIDVLDRAEYDALPEKDPKTLYLIRG